MGTGEPWVVPFLDPEIHQEAWKHHQASLHHFSRFRNSIQHGKRRGRCIPKAIYKLQRAASDLDAMTDESSRDRSALSSKNDDESGEDHDPQLISDGRHDEGLDGDNAFHTSDVFEASTSNRSWHRRILLTYRPLHLKGEFMRSY